MDMFLLTTTLILLRIAFVHCLSELPKFHQLTQLYPGYYQHGGRYRDHEILQMIQIPKGSHAQGKPSGSGISESSTMFKIHTHDTASLRLSWMLNKFGGRHAIGTAPILLSKQGRDSLPGHNGQEYIFRNTAFGPYLAAKYGDPVLVQPASVSSIAGKQGIVRLVSYKRAKHNHPAGHVALWDCDHFHQSRDWMQTHQHLIALEFWETPDSYCPERGPTPKPLLEVVDKKVVLRLAKQRGATEDREMTEGGATYHSERTLSHKFLHHRHSGRTQPGLNT